MCIETIGVFFLLLSKDISNPRHITLDVCDNIYGGYCMDKSDLNVIEILQL